MASGAFCAAINCMDGRAQLPVFEFLQTRFGIEYVDMVTEPGPNAILARQDDPAVLGTIRARLDVSVHKHGSKGIAVVAHSDCAGNPASKDEQLEHLRVAVEFVRERYPETEVIALWLELPSAIEELDM